MVPSPMEFMGRLAALVLKPRVNLTRFHGVFSPHSKLREYIVSQHPVEDQVNQKKGLLATEPRSDGRSGSSVYSPLKLISVKSAVGPR